MSIGSKPPLPGRLRSVVAPLLALMRPLHGQLTYSDATIEHLAVQDPRVPRLRSVPSIGPITAAAFLAAIDAAQRFPHAHQLAAYLGLVPGERRSGETQRRGAITKAGHSRPRWLLIQAAVLGDNYICARIDSPLLLPRGGSLPHEVCYQYRRPKEAHHGKDGQNFHAEGGAVARRLAQLHDAPAVR